MAQKVLIVEDDSNIAELLHLYLEKEGFETKVAKDGGKGVEYFRSFQPALVLLDIMLPVMDGWTVLKKIREESATPVIMLTAKGETEDKVTGLESGADDYIVKPFEMKEVLARIHAVMRRTGQEEEQGDQVGHCHQGVEDVGEIPYHLQALRGTQKGRQGEENSIERDGPAAEEKCKGRFPAELPSQDGGEGEQHDPQGDQQPPQGAQHGLKGQGGEGHAVYLRAGSVGSPQHAGGADAQARDCADHCGVEEYAGHVQQRG